MPLTWMGEGYDYPTDPGSGATTARLTTTAKHHVNVYCEHAYSSADGKRIAILRSERADPRLPPFDLLVGDLETLGTAMLEEQVASLLVATASWSGWIYYLSHDRKLVRVSLTTLQKEVVWPEWNFSPDFILHTVSPDLRYLVGQLPQANYETALVRIDLDTRTAKTIFEHPEISNAHPQFNPVNGKNLLVMMIRGKKVNDRQEYLPVPGSPPGVTHFLIDRDGGDMRPLPLGLPCTPGVSGHSQWIADTGRVACTVAFNSQTWELYPDFPDGNLFTAAPGDAEARVFHAPEHRFNHIAVSKCGRYFVCDSYWKRVPGPVALVVGNFETGKYRMLLEDCKASGGAAACSHPHAYFTADNRHVVYNADPFMIGHVHFARVPPEFLASLD